jgi:hypothetical protein
MVNIIRVSGLSISAILAPTAVLAHGGHLADLAGHSHWVGVAALVGAATIAAVAAKLRGQRGQDNTPDGEETTPDAEPESAQ